jgi:DUF4097 and DUF4098 domain-containing protein YvlB
MRKGTLWAILCIVASVAPVNGLETVEETVVKTLDFHSGHLLKIEAINGDITIKTWDREKVEMVAIKRTMAKRKKDAVNLLEKTAIDIQATATGLTIRTRHPSKSIRLDRKHIEVSYHLMVPSRVDLKIQTTHGAISVSGTRGALRVESTNGELTVDNTEGYMEMATTNGSIAVDGAIGQVTAQTTNGEIHLKGIQGGVDAETTNGAVIAESVLAGDKGIRIQTTNGSIRLSLPPDLQAQLEARTSNGKISTEFPITVQGLLGGRSINGLLNGGGESKIRLESTNGSIEIGRK